MKSHEEIRKDVSEIIELIINDIFQKIHMKNFNENKSKDIALDLYNCKSEKVPKINAPLRRFRDL